MRTFLFLCSFLSIPAFFGKTTAQEAPVKEIRHYEYSENLLNSSNRLYRFIAGGERGRYATWKDLLVANSRPSTALSLNPSGSNFALATDKHLIELWSFEKKESRIARIKAHTEQIHTLDYSYDARYLLSGSADGTVRIWDSKTGEAILTLPVGEPVLSACFDPSGLFIANSRVDDVVVWNFSSRSILKELTGHTAPVKKVKFSDDGRYLLSCDEDNTVILWNTADWSTYRKIYLTDDVKDIDIHNNNKYLAVIGETGNLSIWNLKKKEVAQQLPQREPGVNVHFSYDYEKEKALLVHTGKKYSFIWDAEGLEPHFGRMAAQNARRKFDAWSRKRPDENPTGYALRMSNDSLQTKRERFHREAATELGLKWRPLYPPTLSAYNPENISYTLTFPNIEPVEIKVSPANREFFESEFSRAVFSSPVYRIDDRDEFHLDYLEILMPHRTYYLDNINRISLPEDNIPVSGAIIQKVGEEEAILKQKLTDYFEKEVERQRISDNIKVNVEAKAQKGTGEDGSAVVDYAVNYSYEVLNSGSRQVGDWEPGRYLLEESNAAQASVQVIRRTFEEELAPYLKEGKRISVRITGSADGSPVRQTIGYDGRYGDFLGEPYYLNGNIDNITITAREGIKANDQLAYLRTFGVRRFLETSVPILKRTRNQFEHHVFVAESRGNEFRRVSIEITIHDAFAGVKLPENPVLPPVEKSVNTVAEEQPEPQSDRSPVPQQYRQPSFIYYVVVGSFTLEENAWKFRQELIREGLIHSAVLRKDGVFRVAADHFNNRPDADKFLISLRRKYTQFQSAWLLIIPE
jgi:hypothetical protein